MTGDGTPPTGVEPGRRGYTTINDRVLRKIATHAVGEVERASGVSRRLMGVTLGGGPTGRPAHVDVSVDGDRAAVHVVMSVSWPAPVRDVVRQVRTGVADRLRTFTGLKVSDVDVDVTDLVGATGEGDRRRVV